MDTPPIDMTRTLFVSLNYPPPLVGGSQIYWNQILTRLPPESLTVLVSSKGDPAQDQQFDAQFGFKTIRLPVVFHSHQAKMSRGEKIRLLLKWAQGLYQQLDPKRYDVVIMQDIYNLGLFIRVLCQARTLPYVVSLHGEELAQALKARSLRGWYRLRLYQWVLRGSHGVIVNAHNTRDLLRQMGIEPKRLQVVYPPTPPMPSPTPEQIMDWRAQHQLLGKRIVLSVGRLIQRKGHDYLLQAWAQVAPQFPDAVLVIAGGGTMYNTLAATIQALHLVDNVRLLGMVDEDIKPILYAACEFFVMPNRALANGDIEGYGIVFNEANLFGKPGIGGNSGGTPEAMVDGETGMLVDSTSISSIAGAITKMLEYPQETALMGQRAQHWMMQHRSADLAALQTAQILKEVTT